MWESYSGATVMNIIPDPKAMAKRQWHRQGKRFVWGMGEHQIPPIKWDANPAGYVPSRKAYLASLCIKTGVLSEKEVDSMWRTASHGAFSRELGV